MRAAVLGLFLGCFGVSSALLWGYFGMPQGEVAYPARGHHGETLCRRADQPDVVDVGAHQRRQRLGHVLFVVALLVGVGPSPFNVLTYIKIRDSTITPGPKKKRRKLKKEK